ncbi:MAG: HU family DNA-binding protein [Limnochordia bacterium]|jgi:DNA-binding protein HU-beta
MNKSELIAAVAEATGLTRKAVGDVVEATLDTIADTLSRGEKISLVGFGTFEVRERAARTGINPATKEPIDIPATKTPAFKAGKQLKEAVRR